VWASSKALDRNLYRLLSHLRDYDPETNVSIERVTQFWRVDIGTKVLGCLRRIPLPESLAKNRTRVSMAGDICPRVVAYRSHVCIKDSGKHLEALSNRSSRDGYVRIREQSRKLKTRIYRKLLIISQIPFFLGSWGASAAQTFCSWPTSSICSKGLLLSRRYKVVRLMPSKSAKWTAWTSAESSGNLPARRATTSQSHFISTN
jgi:hypothetical protein